MPSTSRKSKKRAALYAALRGTTAHPSAETLHNALKSQFPSLSLGTVYSNLAAFKRDGIAASVGIVAGKERFDGNVAPHPHFVCRQCAAVFDLHDLPLPKPPPGHVTESTQLCYHGLCKACVIAARKERKDQECSNSNPAC